MNRFVPERFTSVRTLRESRHSKTFLADDHLLDREKVVVRIIKKDHGRDRDEIIERLSWLTGVRHPYFADVLDAGVTKQQHLYYVREYLPPSDASVIGFATLIEFLVSAIDFLCTHGQVHGAIKLSNIFVTPECIRLSDARLVGHGVSDNEESVHFIAPEILQGSDISHEGDLYSLGAVLYLALTGRHLFEDHDGSRLRSKYLCAFPKPATPFPGISQVVFTAVSDLVSKNPEKRTAAFERIKRTIDVKPVLPYRGPFVGREILLKQAVETVEKGSTTLRTLLVEGEHGIGKSRFVTELRLHSLMRGITFIVWRCTNETDELASLREDLCKMLRSDLHPFHVNIEQFLRMISNYAIGNLNENEKRHAVEKIVSELIFLMSVIARRIRVVLAIEDVHQAGSGRVLFLHQLALRASEIPITVVLTREAGELEPSWIDTMKSCLTCDFLCVRLSPFSQLDSEKLVRFLENNHERRLKVLRLGAGNPLFIQEYAQQKDSFDAVPSRVATAAASMISRLTKNTRRVLEILSVFRRPVHADIVADLYKKHLTDLKPQLSAAQALDFVNWNDEGVEIRASIVRDQLYQSIEKKTRVRLNRDAFLRLTATESGIDVLAHHAFEGHIYAEAAALYRELAEKAYATENYRSAANHYERVRQCNVICGEAFAANDRMFLARCYEWLGKSRVARRIYHELLALDSVRNDPELLSSVYARLALAFDSTSTKERIHVQELAIRCLAPGSVTLGRRYAQLCNLLLRAGDLARAEQAFRDAEQCILSRNDESLLHWLRGLLLTNIGDFRGAVRCLLSCDPSDMRIAVSINAACCLEQLGDLENALEQLLNAEQLSLSNGNTAGRAVSLSNRAAIRTKQGEMLEAKQLFNQAYDSTRSWRISGKVLERTGMASVACDAALHSVYMGFYRQAADYLRKASVPPDQVLEVDRLSFNLIRCKFFLEIGLSKKACELLKRLNDSTLFESDFFQVERALIETRLPEIPAKDRLANLQHALSLSERLGTLYQECEVLISLASVQLEAGESPEAEGFAKRAFELANKNGYKILAARALLLCGLTSNKQHERRHLLSDGLQLASEMGLQELIAETAYHLGVLNVESGNIVTAREYLIRSTSITVRLADEVPTTARGKYLARAWRRDAIRALDKCNAAMPLDPAAAFNADADTYFAAAYQFTMAAATANSVEGLLNSINKVLTTSITRSALITLKGPGFSNSIPVGIKSSPELVEHIELIRNHAKNRVYFESAEGKGKQVSAWIPLKSETTEGGIYLTCRSHESPFTEKEIELLTMLGTIGCSALKRLETRQAQETECRELSEFHGIIGASKQIRDVFSLIQIAAGNAATVLIEGESGTGKELVAKAIHAAGPRAKQPFVPVDCGAIPEALVEAELFGSRKGSYTGAVADRPGLFEAAHRGTIFLDEISNTTPALQAKLLRVIQEREVRRIGETKGRAIDVRLIVASNQSLDTLAEGGQFRKDLLFRLKVLHIKVPPLRTRRDDIPMLAYAFLQKLNASSKTKKYFAAGVVEHLALHEFPGNVRELQHAVERAFFLSNGIMINEIPLARHTPTAPASGEEVQVWFKDLSEGRKDFWSAIHNRYKRRDISREKVVALVDFGLRATRGSYTTMASMFRLKQKDYRRFMDFLRRNDCLLDFRPYRKAAAASREN